MTHPLVNQLAFVRSEFQRCLKGLGEEDAVKRIQPMNCISWIIGHLANQENTYWVYLGQEKVIHAHLRELVGYGKPATTPPLVEMQSIWQEVTVEADKFLNSLTAHDLLQHFNHKRRQLEESIGTMLYRNIYHYWFHTGEAHAIRQVLGHENLPDFVGNMQQFPYQPE
jgi:uncharacterized damage-inducible protein DinB